MQSSSTPPAIPKLLHVLPTPLASYSSKVRFSRTPQGHHQLLLCLLLPSCESSYAAPPPALPPNPPGPLTVWSKLRGWGTIENVCHIHTIGAPGFSNPLPHPTPPPQCPTHIKAHIVWEQLHSPPPLLIQQSTHFHTGSTSITQLSGQPIQGVTTVYDVLNLTNGNMSTRDETSNGTLQMD